MSEKILREALEIARQYVATIHHTIKSATGKHDNLVLPDLEKIDAALGAVPEGAGKGELTLAALDVLAERKRQIKKEGWTAEHDDEHNRGELARAAGHYALFAHDAPFAAPPAWPWDLKWWKPKSARENLVRAGALILAEIERIDRALLEHSAKDHNRLECDTCETERWAGAAGAGEAGAT